MSVFGSLGLGNHNCTDITRCGLNPSGALYKSQKLRTSKPAATISTSDSANSVTTSTRSVRVCSVERFDPRPSTIRYATLIQPITITNATAIYISISDSLTLPTTLTFRGTNPTVPLLSAE